jgi:radical SAM protein with 4Fe4S-binding SPASM domain
VTKDLNEKKIYGGKGDFTGVIHPIHAMMLSFFNGSTFSDTIQEIQDYFGLERTLLVEMLEKLVCNEDFVRISFLDKHIYFPKNVIIPMTNDMNNHEYCPEMFNYSNIDLKFDRLRNPLDMTINFTSKCMTDCIYCYADRREKVSCTIPLERLYDIIDEAKELDLRSIDVIGGEFFLYEYWFEVLQKLKENGFTPYLSTKIALKKDVIEKLNYLGFNNIQISLDSMIKENLLKSVQVSEKYYYNIQETFKLLEKYNFNVKINTILSSATDSVDDMKSLSNFFLKFRNIVEWRINYGEYSMYLGEEKFKKYKARKENVNSINEFVEDLNQNKIFDFEINPIEVFETPEILDYKERKEVFEARSTCSGNLYSMYILPDGKVTICEELYWNPHFIIGDITKQSISEVWNSDKAKGLYYLTQDRISENSVCKTCELFEECRGDNYKKTCWRDTVKAYGNDKWDYPDNRCPLAPAIEKEIFA